MRRRPTTTWELALPFLATPEGQRAEPLVRRFHRWLDCRSLTVMAATPEDIESFFAKPFRKLIDLRTVQVYKRGLIGYLKWLDRQGYLGFDPKSLGLRHRRPLPELAETFLRSLEPTHRPSTCRGHRTSLQHFHEWLDDGRLSLSRLNRQRIEQWLLSLSDRGLHPSTRVHMIQHARAYLRWLDERGQLRIDPELLIRGSDLPKLPTYLPRPLPPDIDRTLQDRLARSLNPLWHGLLLMRHTGLRVGELRALEFECVRTDTLGNRFLKVPLGKLNSERLVPIGAQTLALIESMQISARPKRVWLLETASDEKVDYVALRDALRCACEGLSTTEPITSHRLRHTYATSMLEAGMSLLGVMKLLGHRDFRMTLRYTAITQETVGREYAEALTKLSQRYASLQSGERSKEVDPVKMLADLVAWTNHQLAHEPGHERIARALSKSLSRARETLLTRGTSRGPQED
ncbi:MAG TPA: tyrosine-type recombinase/integrase [Steroidobacteraceae bacterium]|nr:tyrosine-type recombinase/integrase [Steroidobacteraceae bacterium]